MALSMDGKRVLVTGAGRGIGRATALAFAQEGAKVTLAARTLAQLEEVAAEIGEDRAQSVVCDVSRPEDVAACVKAAQQRWGGVDILVHCAGIAPTAKITHTYMELWDQVMAVNLTSSFLFTQAVLPAMIEAGWGRVIHMGSIASKSGMQYVSAYCASKHGLLGMIRASALEIARTGVTINAVCPGYVETSMTQGSIDRLAKKTGRPPEELRGHMEAVSPQKRLMEVDEIAGTVLFLASESARGINGQGVNVCGGSVLS